MNWNLLMYITLVILIAVLMYMFREKYRSIFSADNNTNDEQADANVNKQSAPPENKEMNNENIKKAALGEVEKQFVDAALDRTKKHGLKKRGHDRAVEALDVFDNLMAQSMSLGIETENNEIKLTEETRAALNLNFRNEALEPFTKHAVTLRRDGAIGMSLEALPFLAQQFKPIMTPNSTFRVTNFLALDHSVWLATKTGTPLYIEDELTGELHKLTPTEATKLIVNKSTLDLQNEAITANEKLTAATEELERVKELFEANKETSLYASDEINRLRDEEEKNKKSLMDLRDRIKQLEKEKLDLIKQVNDLKNRSKNTANIGRNQKGNQKEKAEAEKNQHRPKETFSPANKAIKKSAKTIESEPENTTNSKPLSTSPIAPTQKMPIADVYDHLRASITMKNPLASYRECGLVYWGFPGAKSLIICEIKHFMKACELWAEKNGLISFKPNGKTEKYYLYLNGTTVYFEAIMFNTLISSDYICPNIYPRTEKYYEGKIKNGAFDIDDKQMDDYKAIISDIQSNNLKHIEQIDFALLQKKEPF